MSELSQLQPPGPILLAHVLNVNGFHLFGQKVARRVSRILGGKPMDLKLHQLDVSSQARIYDLIEWMVKRIPSERPYAADILFNTFLQSNYPQKKQVKIASREHYETRPNSD